MKLPCGKCIGCREDKAKEWALRCNLEMQDHKTAAFTTLTYNEKNVPPSLDKQELAKFLKRLRKRFNGQTPNRTIRFFASGEYGEKTHRPHYHAVLFGSSEADAKEIQAAWPHGHAYTVNAGPGALAYVAGYTAKKIGDFNTEKQKRVPEGHGIERVDQETGEVYWTWQSPFIQMSRGGSKNKYGIGKAVGKKFVSSWRNCAVLNGKTQKVPKYLNDIWKEQATEIEKEVLEHEKYEKLKQIVKTQAQLEAQAEHAIKRAELKASRRKKI